MTENAFIAIRISMLNFDYRRDSLLSIDTEGGAHAPVCEWVVLVLTVSLHGQQHLALERLVSGVTLVLSSCLGA